MIHLTHGVSTLSETLDLSLPGWEEKARAALTPQEKPSVSANRNGKRSESKPRPLARRL